MNKKVQNEDNDSIPKTLNGLYHELIIKYAEFPSCNSQLM